MLASGVFANSPKNAKSSDTRCSSVKTSGKTAKILAAKEISLVSISIPEEAVKDLTIALHL